MNTQRVNTYKSGMGIQVFYIEQYNPDLREWFIVGDTYDKYEHADSIVKNHNIKEVFKLIDVEERAFAR